MNEAFLRLKYLEFEKQYLRVESKSQRAKLNALKGDGEEPAVRKSPIQILRNAVTAIRFITRMRKTAPASDQRIKTFESLYENWSSNRSLWDFGTKQSPTLLSQMENLS